MKKYFICILLFAIITNANAGDQSLEKYISNFDYAARKEMKIDSHSLINLLKQGEAQLIDIRFKEEYAAWKIGASINIPLNELPKKLDKLDKTKIIVTACPHKDRAIIAMIYLRSKGIKAKYLTDGLIGMTENLRGDNAKDFIDKLNQR
ncbi:Rhodanese-related sulfurtransferase [hydrothermal vent metagenome]|uniref:Rhodanese-related sulfurtransferase n=1 Tax=hydrothermal vent metagenome TaxID=652676 RepID=A0A3B0XQZ2_9ZZZZ